MNVPVVECDGWEGDDLLGTFAKRGEAEGLRVLLFTGDRDAYQLVTERVSVVSTKKGITEIVVYDPEAVEARLGVRPDQVADFLGLKGDTSDNIPGVPGIGEKTAAKLIQEYGSLDAVLENAEKVAGKVGENLRAHTDDALASRQVATIRTDAPVECDIELALWGAIDSDAVVRVFSSYRMVSLVERVLALGRAHSRKLTAGAGDQAIAGAADEQECAAPDAWPMFFGDEARAKLEAALAAGETLAAAAGESGDSLFPSTTCTSPWPRRRSRSSTRSTRPMRCLPHSPAGRSSPGT